MKKLLLIITALLITSPVWAANENALPKAMALPALVGCWAVDQAEDLPEMITADYDEFAFQINDAYAMLIDEVPYLLIHFKGNDAPELVPMYDGFSKTIAGWANTIKLDSFARSHHLGSCMEAIVFNAIAATYNPADRESYNIEGMVNITRTCEYDGSGESKPQSKKETFTYSKTECPEG